MAAAISFAPFAGAQVQLQYVGTSPGSPVTYTRAVQLPSGDQVLVGSGLATVPAGLYPQQTQHYQISLADFGATFQTASGQLGGSGNDIPQDATVDTNGNVWIVGKTDSDDFRLVSPIFAQKVPYRTAGFIAELNPTGTKVLFATYLAGEEGSTYNGYTGCSTYASAVTTDSFGNVYVGGSTNEADFLATSAPISLASTPCTDNFGNTQYYSFVLKISAAGQMIFGNRLITGTGLCVGGSRCLNQMSTAAGVTGLAVDSSSDVTVAGLASGSYNPGAGYILKLSPDGSTQLWSAATPSNFQAVLSLYMAQDANGNIDLFGQYAPLIPISNASPGLGTPGLFAARLNPDGSPGYSTDLGQSRNARAAGMVLDASGNAYLAGTSSSPQFPTLTGVPNLGPDFTLRLDSTGAKAQTLFRFPSGVVTAPPALDRNGRLLLLEAQGGLLALPPTYKFDSPAVIAFANSASFVLNTGLYPGALVSLYGFDLPSSPQGAQVTIGGTSAPLLYSGATQINLQVPFELPPYPGNSAVQLTSPGGSFSTLMPESPAVGIFTVDGVHAAAVNEDGTVNSASNPAAQGSVVSLFGTGAIWPAPMRDGAVATAALSTQYPFALTYFAQGSGVIYAGTAPGLVDGVFQVNLQLPMGVNPIVTLQQVSTSLVSNPVVVYAK